MKVKQTDEPNVAVEWLTLLLRVWMVSGRLLVSNARYGF